MSQGQSSNKKRNASVAGMGHSDKESKKTKLEIEVEPRLFKLQQDAKEFSEQLGRLGNFAPEDFVNKLAGLCDYLNKLTAETVRKYTSGPVLAGHFLLLDSEEANLIKPLPPMDSQQLEFTKRGREVMVNHVKIIRNHLLALADQIRAKPAPNKFADSKEWRNFQWRHDAILCRRPADKRGLPIPLMHTAFCKFVHRFYEPLEDDHTSKYLSIADKLCQAMPSAFDTESHRQRIFEEIFYPLDKGLTPRPDFTLEARPSTVLESAGQVDMAKTTVYKGGELVLMLEEFKLECTGDAYMQNCRSYEVLCGEAKNQQLVNFGYPIFLLCVLGIIEDATKKGTTEKLPEPYLIPGCPDNRLLYFDDWQGTFVSPVRNENNSDKPSNFLAQLHKTEEEYQHEVAVKFVYNYTGTYGEAVHQYLSDLDLAPRLYCAKELHVGLFMVVMEHLSFEKGTGGWVELDTFRGKLGDMADAVRKKLEGIIGVLQDQKMVHADLRPTNIMMKVDGNYHIMMHKDEPILRVIDFDWAGKANEARYPPFLNPK
ncbi:15633_t:CDS:2, partial [Acaulospora colombiana]